nr:immunoglobulin heavy chain junction region [Mus musculus]
CARDVAMDYW